MNVKGPNCKLLQLATICCLGHGKIVKKDWIKECGKSKKRLPTKRCDDDKIVIISSFLLSSRIETVIEFRHIFRSISGKMENLRTTRKIISRKLDNLVEPPVQTRGWD